MIVRMLLLVAAFAWLPPAGAATQQVVQLKAADGRSVPALVTWPDGGPDTQAPVAIIHHGGPGGHPLRSLSAARWAADYFASRGYIAISIASRIGYDVIAQPFGAQTADIRGAVDWAGQVSRGPIVLVGHSSGSVSVTLYQATTQDPRVRAIVHYAPTAAAPPWMTANMGKPRYDAVVARLRRLVAEGRGDTPIYEDHRLAAPAPQDITYGYLMNARTWLSWWGPDSIDRNIDLFPKIRVPMLMITGDKDIFVSRAYQEELKRAAVNSPRVDQVILDGGIPHEFVGAETRAAAMAYEWLAGIGIRPAPRVATRVVDLKLSAFDIRPGVIYEPADAALRKPLAVMLLPDFADDVLLTPFDDVGPRLARAGYTVLIPQHRGSGWPLYRSVASAVAGDQRAWLKYLADQGHPRVVVVAHGLAGVMTPALPAPIAQGPVVAGVALIQPPGAPAAFAQAALGGQGYARAVAEAEAAVKRGDGGTAMIVAPFRANGRDPATRAWLNYMAASFLSYWGPSAPPAPIPALTAIGVPVLLVDAGRGRFLGRDAQSALAAGGGVTSRWYEGVAGPFDAPDRVAADLAVWLDGLPAR